MTLPVLAVQLAAWAQEELEAQREYLTALQRQEAAVRRAARTELSHSLEDLDRALEKRALREARRSTLLAKLADRFGVAPGTMTLRSVIERLGSQGIDTASLRARREELRGVVAEVTRTGRRLAAVAKVHQGLLDEVVRTLAGKDRNDAIHEGALIDARG